MESSSRISSNSHRGEGFLVRRACARSRRCKSSTVQGIGTVSRRQGRHREVGSEGSPSENHALTNRNRIVGPEQWVSWHAAAKPVIPKTGSW